MRRPSPRVNAAIAEARARWAMTEPDEPVVLEGYVYFIVADLPRPMVKIGWSSRPDQRFSALQTGSPVKLRFLHMFKAPMQEEGLTRKRFKHLHSHGEWMFLEGDLLEHIRGLMPDGSSPVLLPDSNGSGA